MFGFRKRRERREKAREEHFAMSMHPPISVAANQAAKDRLSAEYAKVRMTAFGPIHVGVIDYPDLRLAHGYGVVLKGYDKWGWPDGHPDSPAQALS